ncbi:MAG TPA: VOC family protein [Mycobacteriales bacterium]|nr:VOC family protein [Mycobacteriales bacterium]
MTDVRLHHVNVVVRPGQTEQLVGFYVDVLGLRRAAKPAEGTNPGGAWFDIGDAAQLHVSERAAGAGPGDGHFALVVDDYDAVLGRLRASGATWRDLPDLFGGRRGSTEDPLGNHIEILERAGQLA